MQLANKLWYESRHDSPEYKMILPLSLKSTQNCFVWNETAKLHTESTAAVDKVYTNECINLLVLEMLKKKKLHKFSFTEIGNSPVNRAERIFVAY